MNDADGIFKSFLPEDSGPPQRTNPRLLGPNMALSKNGYGVCDDDDDDDDDDTMLTDYEE